MKEEKIIDIIDKSEEEVLDAYKEIAKETMIVDEIFKKTNDLNKSIEIYHKLQEENKLNKDKEQE